MLLMAQAQWEAGTAGRKPLPLCDIATMSRSSTHASEVMRLGMDLGGVLCMKQRHAERSDDPNDMYKLAMPGAYPLMLLYGIKHDLKNFFVISRTNSGQPLVPMKQRHQTIWVPAWGTRFLKELGVLDLGMPVENVRYCTQCHGKFGKGPIAKGLGLTHFVDDKDDCVWSVLCDDRGNAHNTIDEHGGFVALFGPDHHFYRHFGQGFPRDDARVTKHMRRTNHLGEVAMWLDLLPDCDASGQVWDWISEHGPPFVPHSRKTLHAARQMVAQLIVDTQVEAPMALSQPDAAGPEPESEDMLVPVPAEPSPPRPTRRMA